MSLYDKIKSDNKRILNKGFSAPITITNDATTPQSVIVQARWTAIGIQFDAEGRPFSAKSFTVGFHVADVSTIMSANENFENWRASFVDNVGNTIEGRLENPMNNQTLGYVHAALITKSSSRPLA